MSKRTRCALGGIIVAGSFFGATAASAGVTTYPGTLCMQLGVDTRDMTTRYSDSQVTTFYGALTVVCPIAQQGGNVLSASVVVKKWFSSANVKCRLTVRNDFQTISASTPLVSTTAAVGTQTLNLGPLPTFFANGTKTITCSIPASMFDNSGELFSYTVSEG